MKLSHRSLSLTITLFSVFAFFLPLLSSSLAHSLHAYIAPVSLGLVTILSITSFSYSQSRISSRACVSMIAVTSALGVIGRLLDFPAGASGMFFVVIVTGYVFGPHMGQLIGMSSMMISAVITGAIGPWLGYQSIAMGIIGAAAGVAHPLVASHMKKTYSIGHGVFAALVIYAGFLGLVYGSIINWWSWPFLDYGSSLSFDSSTSLALNVNHYLDFYIRTSLWWDAWAFAGNVIAFIVCGRHIIYALWPARDFIEPEIRFIDEKDELMNEELRRIARVPQDAD